MQTTAIFTFGVGYQFQGWKEGQTFDVLLGLRNLRLDNELKLNTVADFSSDRDVTDPVIILRPSFPLSERWRFNPTLSYGTGGDSESTYELPSAYRRPEAAPPGYFTCQTNIRMAAAHSIARGSRRND